MVGKGIPIIAPQITRVKNDMYPKLSGVIDKNYF
jgi:hypothetical protein